MVHPAGADRWPCEAAALGEMMPRNWHPQRIDGSLMVGPDLMIDEGHSGLSGATRLKLHKRKLLRIAFPVDE
jgi:hypothetical protein